MSATQPRPRGPATPLAVLACLALAACDGEPPPEIPTVEPTTEELPALFGSIQVVETGDLATVHAIFARDLPTAGPIDGLAWVGVGDPRDGYWAPPEATGELVPVADLVPAGFWGDDRYYDVGEELTVGDIVAPRVQGWTDPDGFTDDGLIYYRDEGGHGPGELGTINHVGFTWSGGTDVEAEARPGAVTRVDALELTSHDPDLMVAWFDEEDLEVAWEDGAGGEVWVTLLGDARWLQARVEDGTSLVLPAAVLRDAIEVSGELRIGRTVLEEVSAAGKKIAYRYTREQRLDIQRTGALAVSPGIVHLEGEIDLLLSHLDGGSFGPDTTFDLGPGIQALAVDVEGGQGPDATVRVLVSADAATGLRDVAATTSGQTTASEQALRVLLPPADGCGDAFGLPGPGTYHGRLAGLVDDASDPSACTGFAAAGPDSMFLLDVTDGELMAATLHYPEVDAVLYLSEDCGQLAQPVACADAGGLSAAETLSHTPLPGEGGTFVLVVDAFGPPPGDLDQDFELVVELLTP
jgi:hypothetical protein